MSSPSDQYLMHRPKYGRLSSRATSHCTAASAVKAPGRMMVVILAIVLACSQILLTREVSPSGTMAVRSEPVLRTCCAAGPG